ncbi:MAG: acetyl ornithine aminotransferase family protein [Vicinamibacterales bacterium]
MAVPDIKTALPGPKAAALIARDRAVISPSYTRGYPFVMARGQGCAVEDVDGNVFLDCAAGIAVNATGHSHPDVIRAIVEQAQQFVHMSGTDFYYERQVEVAEALAAVAPMAGPVKAFFGNSGTEAIEASIKLARYATGRTNLIAFLGSFHGRTMGSLSLTASKVVQRQKFGPLLPGVIHAQYATCYRCPVGRTPDRCQAECLDALEQQTFMQLVSPDEVAAVIVEPIQGEGGYLVAPDQFLQRLRALTSKHGILMIVDEVQSGMGRTGRMFAIEHTGVQPDIVAMAKGIASGMPLGVSLAKADIMTWTPGAHASTFGGNPVACAAALETIRLLKAQLMTNAETVGARLQQQLWALAEKHPLIGDVRGRGLMVGVELVRDRVTKERAVEERNAVVNAAFRRGLLILGAGKNTVRFCPPLVLTASEADTAVALFEEALTEVERAAPVA